MDLTKRGATTISFNILVLQQIQKDSNMYDTLKIKKGGMEKYVDYITNKIFPLHYNPKEYSFFRSKFEEQVQ